MAWSKYSWVERVSKATASRFNNIEEGIEEVKLNEFGAERDWITEVDPEASALTVDSTYLYIADKAQIGRVALATGVYEPKWITGIEVEEHGELTPGGGIAVDAGHVYWKQSGHIGRATIAGGSVEPTWVTLTKGSEPSGTPGLTLSGEFLYFASRHYIGRVKISGSGLEEEWVHLVGWEFVRGLATDGTYLYFVNAKASLEYLWALGRMKLDGTELNASFIKPMPDCERPKGLWLITKGSHIYWTAIDTDSGIGRSELNGLAIQRGWLRSLEGEQIVALTADTSHLYWLAQGHGSVGRVTVA